MEAEERAGWAFIREASCRIPLKEDIMARLTHA